MASRKRDSHDTESEMMLLMLAYSCHRCLKLIPRMKKLRKTLIIIRDRAKDQVIKTSTAQMIDAIGGGRYVKVNEAIVKWLDEYIPGVSWE